MGLIRRLPASVLKLVIRRISPAGGQPGKRSDEHKRSGSCDSGATVRAYQRDPNYGHRPDVLNELDRIGKRLNQPIRIALAGTLKAGKSTLLNALVGENIAPTDATEATRLVTWFRHGPTPKVTANHQGGRRADVPISRNGGLTFDMAALDSAQVIDLDVDWPAPGLVEMTIIDTPGTSSLSSDVSARTVRLLVPDDGVPRIEPWYFFCARSMRQTSRC